MHAILVSAGSDGDVFPFIGLGAKLRSHGHRVTLVANESYAAPAAQTGFAFRALYSHREMNELFGNPSLWHPLRCGFVGAAWGRRFIGRHYELLAELAQAGDPVLIANPAVLAARLVQEKLPRRVASLVIGPWFIPSACALPVVPGIFNPPRWTPRPVTRLFCALLHKAGDLIFGRHLNRVRAELGLKSIRRVFQWWFSPELVIGMFPDWYAPPQADWPPRTRLAGFSMFDGGNGDPVPSAVLDFCREGPPPVAITFGTEMWHAAAVFRAAAEACRTLGVRGLFLTKYAKQLPAPLPPWVRHCAFAPFRHLFPHCAAVVHHGGVGTTAKALAAGIPQLILPFAFDQMDNAARVRQLGVGDWLKVKRRDGAHIATALARLMTPQTREQCRAVAARFRSDDALDLAAQWVEELQTAAFTSCPEPPR